MAYKYKCLQGITTKMTHILSYNEISNKYDERYKQNNLSGILRLIKNYIEIKKPTSIIEIGCGTGRWLNSLAEYGVKLFGLDLSPGMLHQTAKVNSQLHLINASADNLPLQDFSFDFIYCINAIHHFANPQKFISCVKNLLSPGGIFIIVGIDPHNPNDTWYAYEYFEKIREFDLARIPSFNKLIKWANFSGFKNVKIECAEIVSKEWIGSSVLSDIFLQKHNSSQLMQLTEEEYKRGIKKIEQKIVDNSDIVFKTYLTFNLLIMNTD